MLQEDLSREFFFVAGAAFGDVAWRMTCAAALSVNSVSCYKRIDHESFFSWQAQHLVTLEDDLCCSAHCK